MPGTYLQLDEVLLAVDDGELALLVELADVARLEPALPARGVLQEAVPRQVGHVVVPLGDGIAAQPHLACGDGILSLVQYFQHISKYSNRSITRNMRTVGQSPWDDIKIEVQRLGHLISNYEPDGTVPPLSFPSSAITQSIILNWDF